MNDDTIPFCTSHAEGHVPFYLHVHHTMRRTPTPELLDLVAVTDHGILVAAVGEAGVPILEDWHMHGIARMIATSALTSGTRIVERYSSVVAIVGDYMVKYCLEPITTECGNPLGGHSHMKRVAL